MTDRDRDLVAVQLWLCIQPGGEALHFVVQCHIARSESRQIAYVLLVGPGDDVVRRRLRCEVHRALLAWGWRIRLEPGRDIYDVHPDTEHLTGHARAGRPVSPDWNTIQWDPAFGRATRDMLDIAAWLDLRRPDLAVLSYAWRYGHRLGTIAVVHVHRRGQDLTYGAEGTGLALEAVRALGWPSSEDGGLLKAVLLAASLPSAHDRLPAWGRIEAALRSRSAR